jgi:hypothetical protein
MNIANILTEKLPLFINELRHIGYNISTAQIIAIQNLILALAKQGNLPTKLAQFKTLFAPILCHSPKEQKAFGSHFDEWVQTIEKEEISCPDENAISDTLPPVRSTKKWVIIITTVIVIAMLIGSFVFYQYFPRVQETPPTETPDVSEPLPPSPELPVLPEPETTPESQLLELPKPQKPQTDFWWMFLVLLLPLFPLLRYLWRHLGRRNLVRKYTSLQPDIKKLSVETVEENIFQPFELSHAAQQLRKHISIESTHLDITATIEKSIEAGNWFTPVRGTMKRRPEYLVLIDRLTFKDHQTKLVDTLVNQLIDEEVLVNRYYFDATPRRCYPEDTHLAPLTLTDLAAHYPAHKLLIFSDGNGFINPITGKIVDWINQLSIWTHRTLFTLEAPEQWGYQEQLLKEAADFLIMPANEGGLKFLVEQINGNARQSYHSPLWQSDRKNLAFPEMLNENFNRWLERHAPDADVLTELLTQVKLFLGKEAYYWFCACAVYPELHWQVTLYLRKELLTESELLEDFMKLARFPWFRYGYMPDWLREPLIEELAAQQKDKEVHATIEKLLETIGLDKNSEAFIKIASEQPKRLIKHNPLKEQVFFEFMANKLAVKAPERLRHLLGGSFKLPTISKKTVWKVTAFILLITLIFGALEVQDYIKEQQHLAEQALEEKLRAEQERLAKEKAKLQAEQERLAKEKAIIKAEQERLAQEEAKRRAAKTKRQAELQKKQEIVSLLQECEKHLKANRLTTGQSGTAFDCYQTVLKREPNNVQAKEGLAKIEQAYLELIEKSFNNNDMDQVNRYIERVRKVNPNSEIFAEVEKRYVDLIRNAWKEKKPDEIDAYLLLVREINPKSEIFAEIESLRQTEEQRLLLAKAQAIIKAEQERLAKEKAKIKAEQERLAEEQKPQTSAAARNNQFQAPIGKEKRIALVIGNGSYQNGYLLASINDAKAMKKVLEKLGFFVIFRLNANQEQMGDVINEFNKEKLHRNNNVVALFYYSGYGIKYGNENYLIPIGGISNIHGIYELYKTVPIEKSVMKVMQNIKMGVIILDGYHRNPFYFGDDVISWLELDERDKMLITHAAVGWVMDATTRTHNYYTEQLLHFMKKPDLDIEEMLGKVQEKMETETNGKQSPSFASGFGYEDKFVFNPTTVLPEELMATLTVTTNVKGERAKLFVNKNKKGFTPINVKLQMGTYDIRIEKNDYFPFIGKSVNVNKRKQRLHANLKEKAFLRIHSKIRGAKVFINGKYYGMTPIDHKIELPFGQHTIQLKKNSYFVKKEVNIKQREVRIEFSGQKEALLIVSSNVNGAKVMIDFEPRGNTPLSVNLPPNCYTVWVEKFGYTLDGGHKYECLQRGERKMLDFTLK